MYLDQWPSLPTFVPIYFCNLKHKTSKTTFNNDQLRSGKEKDLWLLETL